MQVGSVANTNHAHLGIHAHNGRVFPNRVIVPTPIVGEGTPGIRAFARMLRDDNQTHYAHGTHARGPNHEAVTYRLQRGSSIPNRSTAELLPKLNELVPTEPTPRHAIQVVSANQQVIPATGRVLDVVM